MTLDAATPAIAEVCVVVSARERYATAGRMLEALQEHTPIPFRLVVVATGASDRYLAAITAALARHPAAEIIGGPHFLQPNAARNLGFASVREEFVFFIDNDCFPRRGCLDHLLAVARSNGE
jgi:glycosyltransferase involved in cell wall biosynthesis